MKESEAREMVKRYRVEGLTYQEIADKMKLVDKTRNWHLTRVGIFLGKKYNQRRVRRSRAKQNTSHQVISQPNDRVALADLFWSTLSANQKINIVRKFL